MVCDDRLLAFSVSPRFPQGAACVSFAPLYPQAASQGTDVPRSVDRFVSWQTRDRLVCTAGLSRRRPPQTRASTRLGRTPSPGSAGSHGHAMFHFARNWQRFLQSPGSKVPFREHCHTQLGLWPPPSLVLSWFETKRRENVYPWRLVLTFALPIPSPWQFISWASLSVLFLPQTET